MVQKLGQFAAKNEEKTNNQFAPNETLNNWKSSHIKSIITTLLAESLIEYVSKWENDAEQENCSQRIR